VWRRVIGNHIWLHEAGGHGQPPVREAEWPQFGPDRSYEHRESDEHNLQPLIHSFKFLKAAKKD
jgi:hypothetical protein